jgi:hypothetical protein
VVLRTTGGHGWNGHKLRVGSGMLGGDVSGRPC